MPLGGPSFLAAAALGLGLAAAVGFRVFVPLLLAAIAARTGHLALADGFAWLGSDMAVVILGVAATAEIVAYFIPWFDNLLDTVAGPAAVAAGTLLMASSLVDVQPWLRWSLGLIAGGGTAGLIHTAMAGLRLGSTATTGGLANPAVATFETGAATALTVMAVALPMLALIVVVFLVSRGTRLVLRLRRQRSGG